MVNGGATAPNPSPKSQKENQMLGKYNDEVIILPTAEDAGCWIDGHWGQYGIARMIQIAADHGFVDTVATLLFATLDCVDIARRHLVHGSEVDWQELESMEQATDEVEAWLNENVAPEGYSFGWYDGEFFLCADTEWDTAY
jgi:hypothetical protein